MFSSFTFTPLAPSFPLEVFNCFFPNSHYSSRISCFVYVISFRHLFWFLSQDFAYVQGCGSVFGRVETFNSSSGIEYSSFVYVLSFLAFRTATLPKENSCAAVA